jgi:hypothetical protein
MSSAARRSAMRSQRSATQRPGELARLRTVRAEIGSQQKAAEAEVGPVKFIADVLGVDAGKVVATAVATIYDALCVLLLLVAGHKPAAPVETTKPAAAPRKSTRRSKAARKAWDTRRRRALVATSGKPVVRVK